VVRLSPGTVEADAVQFAALATSDAFADLERAAGLIQGELLAGFNLEEEGFEEWLRQQRHRFETTATGVLERYAGECDRLSKGPQAITAVERLLALSPLREDWQRLALRLYARHRSPSEALAQAKVYAELLQRELDVEPEPETQALIEEIRRGAIAPAAHVPEATLSTVGPLGAAALASPTTGLPRTEIRARFWDLARTVVARASTWARLQPLKAGAAVTASAVVILLVAAVVTGTNGRSIFASIADSTPKAAEALAGDPWQSPRLPSVTLAELADQRAKAKIPIVVLPFKTYGEAAGGTQLLADMMADDVIHMLSRVPGLRVISRSTSHT
jgi:hypothetical protein